MRRIRYWTICTALIIGGALATIWGGPWDTTRSLIQELGRGFFTAGILAALVEPFFRSEFARDAFEAAFHYVLPEEFKGEIGKILRNVFLAEQREWKVEIKKMSNEVVEVTTSFESLLRNKTSSTQKSTAYTLCPNFITPMEKFK
jgi:hypothetical protein